MTQPKPISFAEPERLSEIFDSDNREEWQNTSHILKTLGLQEPMIIADVGAGTGYFTRLFAERVNKVYAIDNEPGMVAYMEKRFNNSSFSNIEIRQSSATNPCLPQQVDIVFLANVYRFIKERDTFLSTLYEQTTVDTTIVFVDFRGAHARVSPETATKEVKQAGFEIQAMDSEGCPDHYIG
ncbi:methyltransferase type 11 [Endozoicomonas montiporae]|uniref:Methyltransferase type 11 n=2 Tax=Endozoicomonas montiporae TaxID=1027273 RepID=A0A081MZ45_9GAMM|nr:class I SAM-dependent methyltransferase [Endozoicomonas montiporae]AMO54943.1 type 11 methyltransferase [Endozoicomonas montiporae CL-33]KEQ11468.1 methyltransferase type 11 [Endozoicomonas montiporae]